MELASLKSEIKKSLCSMEKLGRRTEPEGTIFYICKSNDIREFDERETFLNDKEKFHLLVWFLYIIIYGAFLNKSN